MSEITFNAKAYCKILLHAAKYPHCSINGVLLAKNAALTSKNIEFVDAVPLFHVCINLTPMAEVALAQIDELASQQGLCIAGYYSAHETAQENSIEKAQNRISDKIEKYCTHPCIVSVDNTKLSTYLDNMALKIAQCTDGLYKPVTGTLKPDRTLDACTLLLENKSYNNVVDFDNHLDDPSQDWMNYELNKQIESLL